MPLHKHNMFPPNLINTPIKKLQNWLPKGNFAGHCWLNVEKVSDAPGDQTWQPVH